MHLDSVTLSPFGTVPAIYILQFGRPFFELVQGAAIGSPLSPIMANIFMEDLEMPALETSPCR